MTSKGNLLLPTTLMPQAHQAVSTTDSELGSELSWPARSQRPARTDQPPWTGKEEREDAALESAGGADPKWSGCSRVWL